MEEIFHHFGGPVIIIVAVALLIGILYFLKTPISNAFSSMFDSTTKKATETVDNADWNMQQSGQSQNNQQNQGGGANP